MEACLWYSSIQLVFDDALLVILGLCWNLVEVCSVSSPYMLCCEKDFTNIVHSACYSSRFWDQTFYFTLLFPLVTNGSFVHHGPWSAFESSHWILLNSSNRDLLPSELENCFSSRCLLGPFAHLHITDWYGYANGACKLSVYKCSPKVCWVTG